MNNGVAFAVGLGVGSVVAGVGTFALCNVTLKNKYADLTAIEVESAKTEYRRLVKELKKKTEKEVEQAEKKAKSSVNLNKPAMDILRTNYNSLAKVYGTPEKTESVHIECIAPEDYGLMEEDGFVTEELYFYADGVLANEYDQVVEDPAYAGDFKDHFGDYEDDVVYMRNYSDKIDISITRSLKTYDEAVNSIESPNDEEEEE